MRVVTISNMAAILERAARRTECAAKPPESSSNDGNKRTVIRVNVLPQIGDLTNINQILEANISKFNTKTSYPTL